MATLGETIKELRNKKSLTLKQVGECIGWKSQSVSDIERDKFATPPNTEILTKIAECLEVAPEKLIKLAEDSMKFVRFNLEGMSPKKRELLIYIYNRWDTVTENDAKAILQLSRASGKN